MKRIISGAAAVALAVAGMLAVATPASATNTPPPTEECVPSEGTPGYWEVVPDITHPAEGDEVIDNPDYQPGTEGTPAVWANFSPNDKKATFVGPPTYPTDERGTWHDHGQLPPGHEGEDGVYAKGNPDKGGNWFYRQAAVEGTPPVGEPTIPNPDYKPEWVEVVPDIWHEGTPPVTCEPPTYEPRCTTATGSSTIVGDGVISVPGDWASSSMAIYTDVSTLSDIGTVLDIQADPIQYVGLHINTAQGSIVFEEEPSYGGNLWSESAWNGVSAGMGYAAFGSIEEFIHLNGDVQVTDIILLYTHPEPSSTTVTSFTIACTTFTFVPETPEKPEPVVQVTSEESLDCYTDVVTTTTTTTTTDWVFDQEAWAWVAGEPVTEVDTSTREATDEECPLPEAWSDLIGQGEPLLTCDSLPGDELPYEITWADYTYAYNESGEVIETVTGRQETAVYIVGEDDVEFFLGEECEEPVTPEPKPEPEPAPAGKPSASPKGGLAETGGMTPLYAGGGALALLLAGLGTFAVARRRR